MRFKAVTGTCAGRGSARLLRLWLKNIGHRRGLGPTRASGCIDCVDCLASQSASAHMEFRDGRDSSVLSKSRAQTRWSLSSLSSRGFEYRLVFGAGSAVERRIGTGCLAGGSS